MRQQLLNRRDFLAHSQFGLSGIALASMLSEEKLLADGSVSFDPTKPFEARSPHFKTPARNVIVIFCAGAVSHVDFWEHKPELYKFLANNFPATNG